MYKKLFPIIIALHIWDPWWFNKHILFCSDEAVVHLLTSRTSKCPSLMHLLCQLLLTAAVFGFTFTAQHMAGVQNNIADALSRFHWQEFRHLAPEVQLLPVTIPQQLLDKFIPLL